MDNPYDWQSHHPRIEVPRAEVDKVAKTLRQGGSAVVLGGRGMGKSVFLRQVSAALARDGDPEVVLIAAPPPDLSVRACLDQLADALGVAPGAFNSRKILDSWFAREDKLRRLVLLFDEFDRYAEGGAQTSSNPPGRGFFNDLEATRRDLAHLGVLATGSLGVFVVRDVLGSSFLGRALHLRLTPFARDAASILAQPFAERAEALSADVLDTLHLSSGGIPALLTYGLQLLWEASLMERQLEERAVTEIYARFRKDHGQYLRELLRSVADPRLSEAPLRVLESIRKAQGPIPRPVLEQACRQSNGPLDLDLVEALELLEAAGLVRFEGSIYSDDPVVARPVTSLLNLPTVTSTEGGFRKHLLRDLETLLAGLHRASVDFFRPGRGGKGKQLVPEAVFAAHLALGFELLGWRAEREAQSAAGRTDLKLRRNGSSEVAIVEVKIWGRKGAREAQRQIEGYRTRDVTAAAVVQITDANIADWPQAYQRDCLDLGVKVEEQGLPKSYLQAQFTVESSAASGATLKVDHYLLCLPRRP